MLLANETVAQHLADAGAPTLFRVHEAPDPLKVEEFEEFIEPFGHSLGAAAERGAAAPLPEAGRRASAARPKSARSRC